MLKKLSTLALGAALITALAACGGGSDDQADVTINLRAENNRFVPDRIEIPAGKTIKLTLRNLDKGDHDLEVRGLNPKSSTGGGHGGRETTSTQTGADVLAVHSKGKKSASVIFIADRPGTYEVVCTQQGHKEVGTLVVTGARPAASGGVPNPTPTSPPPPPTATAGQPPQVPEMQPPAGHDGH